MANPGLSNLADVTAALSQRYAKKLYNQFNRVTVTAGLIGTEADMQGNAKNTAWDVQMSGATADVYAEGTDVQNSELNVDLPLPAVLSWAWYRSAFQISESQIDAARASGGTADAAMSLVDLRVMSNAAKLIQKVNQDIWAGTGTGTGGNPSIIGVSGGALSAAVYAGLDSGTYSEWIGNLLANGGVARPLTMDLMEHAEQECWEGVSESPTAIVASAAVLRKYVGLFETIQRVVGPVGDAPLPRFDTSVMLNQGIESTNLFFKGIPVFRDKDAAAGSMLFMNQKYIKKAFLPSGRDSAGTAVFFEDRQGVGTNGDLVRTPTGLPIRIEALAKQGDSYKIMLKTVVQLQVARRNAHALISDIAT